jgi:hypothetical protein
MRRTVSFNGARYPYVQAYILRTSGVTWDGKVFYSTSGHGESGSFYNQMTEPAWDGVNYQWITSDMRSLAVGGADWTNNTITNLRLDFGLAATDDFRVQYIVIRGTIYPIAGLYQSYQLGYHNEDENYMTSPTAEGATNSVNYPSIGENISYQWIGYFLAPTTGIYNFRLASDDGSYFWIGDNAVSGYTTGNANVVANFFTGTVTSGNMQLTAGTYYPVMVASGGSNQTPSIRTAATAFSFDAATNVLTVTATTARYADLAEMYTSDADYPPGTVLAFDGEQEVTISSYSHCYKIAGVVSTNPAHIMNSGIEGEFTIALALSGRVPCSVVGNIEKGDVLVSSDIPGVATAIDLTKYRPGVVIGKAVQPYNSDQVGVIEVVVGRL